MSMNIQDEGFSQEIERQHEAQLDRIVGADELLPNMDDISERVERVTEEKHDAFESAEEEEKEKIALEEQEAKEKDDNYNN